MKINFRLFLSSTLAILLFSCNQNAGKDSPNAPTDLTDSKKQIAALLDSFNIAAAKADYNTYFNYFTEDAIFIGTDATENWDKKSYMTWAKPYFDKKTTWNFTSIERHIFFGTHADIAWFDELLSTQMKICRGSGVVVKQNNEWKVQQYVLSMTIPNSRIDTIIKIKSAEEDSLISKISNKQ